MSDLVECHAGYAYAEYPTAIHWQGQRLRVLEIVRRWREPGKKCFQVCTEDDQFFDVSYDEGEDTWFVAIH